MSDQEEPEISSTLLWENVTLPPSVTVFDLDAAILSELKPNWLKVARIVGFTAIAFEKRSIPIDYEIVGARIRALAEERCIESQGDLSKWRFSEVRLKPSS